MALTKRAYALPEETIAPFEQLVPPGKRSATVAELLQGWLERRRRQKLRAEIIEGCREMADVYREIERDFHPLEEEVERVLEAAPKTRRSRSCKA